MSYRLPPAIQNLIDQNLATGEYSSEEHALEAALHALCDYHPTVADIKQGLIDYEHGFGEPLAEAVSDIRRHLRL
jgi:hypothetical protein